MQVAYLVVGLVFCVGYLFLMFVGLLAYYDHKNEMADKLDTMLSIMESIADSLRGIR